MDYIMMSLSYTSLAVMKQYKKDIRGSERDSDSDSASGRERQRKI